MFVCIGVHCCEWFINGAHIAKSLINYTCLPNLFYPQFCSLIWVHQFFTVMSCVVVFQDGGDRTKMGDLCWPVDLSQPWKWPGVDVVCRTSISGMCSVDICVYVSLHACMHVPVWICVWLYVWHLSVGVGVTTYALVCVFGICSNIPTPADY